DVRMPGGVGRTVPEYRLGSPEQAQVAPNGSNQPRWAVRVENPRIHRSRLRKLVAALICTILLEAGAHSCGGGRSCSISFNQSIQSTCFRINPNMPSRH